MTSTANAYRTADRPLTAILAAVPATAWSSPSPCEGWSAADVVGHLVTTQRDFLSRHGADLGGTPDVAADPAAAWRAHADLVTRALSDDALLARGFEGFFGPTTVGATFERFHVWDMLVHRWDVARAVGADAALTDEELDRIGAGADGFGPALNMEGICRPAVEVPEAAPREARVLARLGRTA